jgi:hypothetical protein
VQRRPELVRRKVATVAVQGGLVADASAPYGWAPDTSVNNEFDADAARFVYDWCFAQGVPMSVVSRHAVPMLPMQLARSFAERTSCPIMRYLADAQFLGLEGLWQKLCAGKLPARCSKQWYFETFCGVSAAEFAAQQLDALGADAPIVPRLNGYVKPYDVVALLAALGRYSLGLHGSYVFFCAVGTALASLGGPRRYAARRTPTLTVPNLAIPNKELHRRSAAARLTQCWRRIQWRGRGGAAASSHA